MCIWSTPSIMHHASQGVWMLILLAFGHIQRAPDLEEDRLWTEKPIGLDRVLMDLHASVSISRYITFPETALLHRLRHQPASCK